MIYSSYRSCPECGGEILTSGFAHTGECSQTNPMQVLAKENARLILENRALLEENAMLNSHNTALQKQTVGGGRGQSEGMSVEMEIGSEGTMKYSENGRRFPKETTGNSDG